MEIWTLYIVCAITIISFWIYYSILDKEKVKICKFANYINIISIVLIILMDIVIIAPILFTTNYGFSNKEWSVMSINITYIIVGLVLTIFFKILAKVIKRNRKLY